ncbi:MAG: glycosyltransferase [Proteobacteria bacterium]|nr:glycosyltransferase [Pseudomonadota bacterium]
MIRLAVFFDNLGPYHIARLTALARQFEVLAVETRARSREYSWQPAAEALPFSRVTLGGQTELFDRGGALDGVLSRFRPHVLAVSGYTQQVSLAVLAWAQAMSIPTICMSESQIIDAKRYSISELVKRSILRNFSSALVGGSRHVSYLEALGVSRERIFVGYDAVDNDYFSSSALGLRGDDPHILRHRTNSYFLASSRFVEKKNLVSLLRAFERFYRATTSRPGPHSQTSSSWKLVLLGDGVMRGTLLEEIRRLGLERVVELPGFVQYEELPQFYAFARGFVHVSTAEQWGLVVNEAMASGLPVIVSRPCGCVPELVKHGENGFVVEPLSIDEIADRLTQLAENQDQAETMGLRSASIISDWGVERFAGGMSSAVNVAVNDPVRRVSHINSLVFRLAAVALSTRA